MQLQWIPNIGYWDAVCSSGCTYQQQHLGVTHCTRLSSFGFSTTLRSHRCLLDSKSHTFYFLPVNFSRIIADVKVPVHSSKLGRSVIELVFILASLLQLVKKEKKICRWQIEENTTGTDTRVVSMGLHWDDPSVMKRKALLINYFNVQYNMSFDLSASNSFVQLI